MLAILLVELAPIVNLPVEQVPFIVTLLVEVVLIVELEF
jgi:hypothetical protein